MKTILVVGREWKFRALLRAQLREEGYDALGFETLQDAEGEVVGAAALIFDTTDSAATDWQPVLQRLAAQLPTIVVSGTTEEVTVPGAKLLRRPLSLADIIGVCAGADFGRALAAFADTRALLIDYSAPHSLGPSGMNPPKPNGEPLYPEGIAPPPAAGAEPLLPRLFAPRTGVLRSLRHPNYRLFWAGNFLSNIGTWMHQVALGWLVLEMTNSPFLLGLVGFAQFAPALIFSLPSGVLADRVNRRKWLLATHAAMLAVALAIAVLTSLGLITYPQIVILAFLLGTTSSISAPAFQAMVRDLSSREDVLNAIALNSVQFNLSRFIGPSIAGILVSAVSISACFYVNAASFLAPLIALARVTYRPHAATAMGSMAAGLADGFRYLRGHKQISLLVSLVALVSLFGLPYLIFLPVFARDVLVVGARGLGYMTSATGGGALLGALVLATWPAGRRRGPLVLGGTLVFFTGVLVVALSEHFYLTLAALVVTGGAMVCSIATVNSLIQTLVPDDVRGRVLSWHTMAYFGFSPIGSLLVGTLADTWGTPAALALSAAGPLVLVAALLVFVPWLRHLQ